MDGTMRRLIQVEVRPGAQVFASGFRGVTRPWINFDAVRAIEDDDHFGCTLIFSDGGRLEISTSFANLVNALKEEQIAVTA